jgi:hypothetical protein
MKNSKAENKRELRNGKVIVSKEAEEAMLQHLADLWEPIEEVTRKILQLILISGFLIWKEFVQSTKTKEKNKPSSLVT